MLKIFAFGDSIVFGRKVDANANWVSRLKGFFDDKLKDEVITYNLGILGETSEGLASRIEKEIYWRMKQKSLFDFNVALIAIGLNDAKIKNNKKQTSEENFINNVNKIIDISEKHVDLVVLVGPIKINENVLSEFNNNSIDIFNKILKKICLSRRLNFVDLFNNWPSSKVYLYSEDGIHPNAKGHNFIYKKIAEHLFSLKREFIDPYPILKNELSISKDELQKFNLNYEIGTEFESDIYLGKFLRDSICAEIVLGGPCLRNDLEGITLNTFYQIFMPIKVASILNKLCGIYLGFKEEIIYTPEKENEFNELKKKIKKAILRISSDFKVKSNIIDTSELKIDKLVEQCKNLEGVELSRTESEDIYSFFKNQNKTKFHKPERILINERVITCHGNEFMRRITGKNKFLIVEDFEQIKAYLYLRNRNKVKNKDNHQYISDFLAFLPLPSTCLSTTMFKSKKEEKIFLSRTIEDYRDLWVKMNPLSKKVYSELLRLVGIPKNQFNNNIDNFVAGMKHISNYFD